MEVVKPVKEVKQPKRSAASSKSDTVVTLSANQGKSELQAKRTLRKKRQDDHQSEIYNMKNENRPIESKIDLEPTDIELDIMLVQDAPKSDNTTLLVLPGNNQHRLLSSSSSYIEEADAFDRHLADLAQHTARSAVTNKSSKKESLNICIIFSHLIYFKLVNFLYFSLNLPR